jgi:hypothetical protein
VNRAIFGTIQQFAGGVDHVVGCSRVDFVIGGCVIKKPKCGIHPFGLIPSDHAMIGTPDHQVYPNIVWEIAY